MQLQKKIQYSLKAQEINMGGVVLDQSLPIGKMDYFDPFLLVHHLQESYPGKQYPQMLGVGPHAHRGFSPVSLLYKGENHHRDSRGNSQIVGAGGTQYMFAGMGMVHSERPSQKLAFEGWEYELIQFWVNAPASEKMKQPEYKAISKENTPEIREGGMTLWLVAWEYAGKQGPAIFHSPVLVLRVHFIRGSSGNIQIPEGYNSLVYIMHGAGKVNGISWEDKTVFFGEMEGNTYEFQADTEIIALVLAGKPLNEKVEKYGPFVMNSQTEIMEALRDANMGKMWVLIEEFE